jgi:16S rRNA C1402 (ribose-2'-O) methylase RsmI
MERNPSTSSSSDYVFLFAKFLPNHQKSRKNQNKENQNPPYLFVAFVFLGYPRKIGYIAKAHF